MTVEEMLDKLTRPTIHPRSEVVFEHELGIFEWDISVNCVADKVLIVKLKKVEKDEH